MLHHGNNHYTLEGKFAPQDLYNDLFQLVHWKLKHDMISQKIYRATQNRKEKKGKKV